MIDEALIDDEWIIAMEKRTPLIHLK